MIDTYSVRTLKHRFDATVSVPGSKSETNRALLLAALADGESTLHGALFSDDSRVCLESLHRLGIEVREDPAAESLSVTGAAGRIPVSHAELFIGNSGTSARFLTAFLALGQGEYLLDGVQRMRERPIGDLLSALTALGADARSLHGNGCPPVHILAQGLRGGEVAVDASLSGQFLSALLMVAPYANHDTTLALSGELVSKPYIDMTMAMMREWGARVEVEVAPPGAAPSGARNRYHIASGQRYGAREYHIAPDASGASYFLAAAALTGGRVTVRNLALATNQGDLRLLDVFEAMGCTVKTIGRDVELTGPERLNGIDIDLNAMSDMTMTLAAIAPFAGQPVILRNVAHIRVKETDRLAATVAELRRLGAEVEELADGLAVHPSALHGGTVRTYDDHRMAMAFAITGLVTEGIEIENPGCVAKTFPDFFRTLEAACAYG
jgi:3-phosphoshikimate 1-carboxyvinyltransferase